MLTTNPLLFNSFAALENDLRRKDLGRKTKQS
jgi:hypothetical protein